jgi:hypothetical protein
MAPVETKSLLTSTCLNSACGLSTGVILPQEMSRCAGGRAAGGAATTLATAVLCDKCEV